MYVLEKEFENISEKEINQLIIESLFFSENKEYKYFTTSFKPFF